ncbi:ribonuclease H-like domain-containing protein [Candidatus Micrarchaeota archaeon]|nr:ribonuclease H-like domain-containing protein [Candidatus Micrarchaeota archaeon]
MGNYYFDIETTGLDPKKHKVITIQYQEIDRNTGKATGELTILKEWESSEREILGKFIKDSGIMDSYAFTFIPTGYNLNFEHNFLRERTALHSFTPVDILNKPSIDLRPLGIIMNKGEFKGSGLDKITGKPASGRQIPEWYEGKEYGKIIEYIEAETRAFLELNAWLYKEMPDFLERFKKEHGIED